MIVEKAKLKALAEAATQGERMAEKCIAGIPHVITEEWDIAEVHATMGDNPMADAEFIAAANPAAILGLLAEIDQLRSDNEALRNDANRYRWLRRVGGRKYGNVLPGVPGTNHIYDIGVDAEMAKESAHG